METGLPIPASVPAVPPGRVGLVVDHPLRDLHGLALVAHLLALQGHTSVLLPGYGQSFDVSLLDLDLLVLNYVRPANLTFIRDAQRRGIPLAVLDTEGGLLPKQGPSSPRGVARFFRETEIDLVLELYMFWGSEFRNIIVSETRLGEERAVVTGCPRFDLAHAPWSNQSGDADMVLINTNFAVVNAAHAPNGKVDWEALRAMGFEESVLQRMVAASEAIMRDMIKAILQIVLARPERKFVLRPHPFERAEPYQEHFGHLPNIKIRREGSVLDVIAQSACMIHVNCTTAVEAAMSGVPPIALEFVNQPEMRRFAEIAGEVSHPAHSLDEVLRFIDRGRDLGAAAGINAIVSTFGPTDGRAAERVTDAITSFLRGTRRCVEKPAPTGLKRTLLALVGQTLGSATIERVRQSVHPARRSKRLDLDEVEAVLARFARAQGVAPAHLRRIRTRLRLPTLSLEVSPR